MNMECYTLFHLNTLILVFYIFAVACFLFLIITITVKGNKSTPSDQSENGIQPKK